MSDDIRLLVAGKEFSGWTGVGIEMAIDQLADSFTVSAPFDATDKNLKASFKEFQYQPFQLFIGTDELMRGRIDVVQKSLTQKGSYLSVAGRSLPGFLMDISLDAELEFSGLSLYAIAQKLTGKFGLKLRDDTRGIAKKALPLARAEYGQTVGGFLNSLAAPRNILLNSSFTGELVFSSGSDFVLKPAGGALVEGKAPLLSASTTADAQKRFSHFVIASQFAGDPSITAVSEDKSIKAYRPRFKVASETDQDPAQTANRMRLESLLEGYQVSATVSGWRRTDGQRWAERQILTLHAPSAGVPTESRFLISSVKHILSAGSKTTSFGLVLPETYSGKMPERFPWD